MTAYLALKAVHVVAVVLFVGGSIVDAIALRAFAGCDASDESRRGLEIVRRWGRRTTTPAMLVVWIAGFGLATTGAWFGQAWLTAKLVLVVALSGIHGVQTGRLRRLAESEDRVRVHPFAPVIVALAALAIVLVVMKPGGR